MDDRCAVRRVAGTARARDDTRLAGTPDGIGWVADVDPGLLRATFVHAGDDGAGGGIVNDRLSQPDDAAQFTVRAGIASIAGMPGTGRSPPTGSPRRRSSPCVESGDSAIAVLGTYRRTAESYFAVPIPDGLTVSRLVLIDADGTVADTVTIPALPPQLGGGYGGPLKRRG